MKNIIYLLFIGLIALSCQQSETSKQVSTDTDISKTEKTVDTPTEEPQTQAPSFSIESSADEQGIPRSKISIEMGGNLIEVTEAIGCEKIERKNYQQYQIPANAADACGGWWAGSGDYFYIVKHPEKNYYMIMQAVVDEQQEGNAYEYSSIMNITQKFK